MSKFKIGDRVVVPEGARVSYGGNAPLTGPGTILYDADADGDVYVKFDTGTYIGYGYGYVLASDVKREKVFVQPGDVSVGDRVRIRVTDVTGDKFKYEVVVTGVDSSYLHFRNGYMPFERPGTTRTIEIVEKAPKPEPIKVGDKIDIEQVKTLPLGSVVTKDDSWANIKDRMVTRYGLFDPTCDVSGWGIYVGDTFTVKYIAGAS